MSSSPLLRRAVFAEAPLLIDNSFELAVAPEEAGGAEDLVETLQHEHPDAQPEDIEDAIQQAIDVLTQHEADPDELLPSDLEPQDVVDDDEPATETTADAEPLITPAPAPAADADAILAEARETAARLVENGRAEAAQALQEADQRAAEIERAAYDKGSREGGEAGKAAGEQHAADMLAQVMAIVNQAQQLHDTMLREAEREMVALCLEIARKIIQAELRTNPDVVTSVLAAAVQKINGSPRVTIKVNPAQVEAVQAHWQRAYGPNYRDTEWAIEGDASVEPGGCALDTKYGSLDARIGRQFSELQKTFALLLGTGG